MKRVVLLLSLSLSLPVHAADWPSAESYTNALGCDDPRSSCAYAQTTWEKDYKGATSGDYQGQRNVAFCLSSGCDNAIRVNKVLGCAWRMVILQSGHLELDDTDIGNFSLYCGPNFVDQAGILAAKAQADQIMKRLGF